MTALWRLSVKVAITEKVLARVFINRIFALAIGMEQPPKSIHREMLRPFFNLSAILAAFLTNVLANVAPINGRTIGDIANTTFAGVLVIPANYAFAIWGLIYVGLIGFGIYQFLPPGLRSPRLHRMGYWLIVASLAQIVWVFLFQFQQFVLSFMAMLAILVSLIAIYWRLDIGGDRISLRQRWLCDYPLSLYLGWISVATIVNGATTLYAVGWNGWGLSPQVWTIAMLAVAGAIGAVITLQRDDPVFPLVLIWAFVAISVRQGDRATISMTAIGLAIAIGLLWLLARLRRQLSSQTSDRQHNQS